MNLKEFIYFYRILNWKGKISCFRFLGYSFFGYAMSFSYYYSDISWWIACGLNAIAILGVLMFSYALNDYYDFKLQGERNFLAIKIVAGHIQEKRAIIYCCIPLIFLLPLLFFGSLFSISLAFVFLLLVWLYSQPPIRFKKRKLLGFLVPPTGAAILFLQAYFLIGQTETSLVDVAALTVILFLFQFYVESIHILSDYFTGDEIKKIDKQKTLKLFKILPIISLFFSFLLSFHNYWFLTTSFFSIVRILSLMKVDIEKNIQSIRKDVFTPIWSLYEFLIYAVAGVAGLFI